MSLEPIGRPQPQPAPVWLSLILRAVKPLLPPDFTGKIVLNCFRGGITTGSVDQTFKYVEDDEPTV